MTPRQAIPPEWADLITDDGPLALGYDVATSNKGKSNPSSITAMQRSGPVAIARLVISWKSAEPEIARQIITALLDDIERVGARARRLNIDASSEKYFAADMRTFLRSRLPVDLIAGNQTLKFRGEEMDAKTLLGNMYCSALEDNLILLPAGSFIELDHRLVKREAGRFVTELGPSGEHGDTFDSGKLAYWGIQNSGTTRAHAAQVGTGAGNPNPLKSRPGLIGPIGGGRLFGRTARRLGT